MRSRIFFKMWLLALTFCGVFLRVLSTSPTVPLKQGSNTADNLQGPVPPLKLREGEKSILNKKSGTELTPDPLTTLMVMATLDGTLTAVDRVSGELKWVSKDEPMIRVPAGPLSTKAPYFLPDPKTGALYMMGRSNSPKKLPFTIPQLVAQAPCKNSEGVMYTGKKMDYWLTLNPQTGEKSEMPMFTESTCPAKHEDDISGSCSASPDAGLPATIRKSLLIGKTEYTLSMLDGRRKWNITYHHYSSVDMSHQASQDYELVHFTSPSTGAVLTYDRESGQLLWQRELDSPVVAVYAVDCDTSNLVSVPFNPIAPETLDRLKSSNKNNHLSPTTYVGESNYGLYAVPALVDDMVLLISTDGEPQLPPLLEGPSLDGNDTPQDTNRGRGSPNNNSYDPPQGSGSDRDVLLLGYYGVIEASVEKLPMQIESSSSPLVDPPNPNSLPPGQYNDSDPEVSAFAPPVENYSTDNLELMDPVPLTDQVTPNKVQFPPFPMPQVQPPVSKAPGLHSDQPKSDGKLRDVKPIKIVFTTALISVAATSTVIIVGFILYRKYYAGRGRNRPVSIKEKASDTEEEAPPKRIKPKKSADGLVHSIGKISFNPSITLGKGCDGTFVFKGKFEDRDVAVKRILPQCFEFADREVDLLKDADQHPNVIRYFCTEADEQFRYIALELCEATVSDWIEGKFLCDSIDPIHILREATDGLAHLHAMRIVHRDVKPANVLLMRSSNGTFRSLISDFGLCKKISNGRMSFSRRSGGIPGTDGWIAPEVLKNMDLKEPQRMSYSVDVFSLGCVYYFVLTNGDHPFGDTLRRQSNIYSGDYDVEKVRDNPQGLYDLLRLMISTDANARPPLSDVLIHPIFWPKEKILQFFLDVSDRIEKESDSCPLLRRLESDGLRIVRDDWRNHVCPEVANDLRKYRSYQGHSVRDLLRALRNKKNHYRELTEEAKASLGHIPDQFVDYWVDRFPDLLPYTWLKFESVRDEPIFSKYYPKAYSFNANINGDDDYDLLEECDNNFEEGRKDLRSASPDKGNKLDKNFWRSKSQFKYNKWRRQQQNTNLRENPSNFVSFGTTRYPPQTSQNSEAGSNFRSPDTDSSWRNPLPKNKP